MLRTDVPILGYRESPRARHQLPPSVLRLLRPWFRYSDWRDAWILRAVGERYGPVLQVAPRRRERSHRRRGLGAATLLMACGIAVAAVLGFLTARSARGGSSNVGLGRPVAAGVIDVAFPDGWKLRPAHTLTGFRFVEGRAAASGDRLIVVGTAATTDPSLLPPSILASLRSPPAGQLVRFHGTTFYRYSQLPLRAGSESEAVYAVPTSSGTILAVCRAPRLDATFAGTCQRVTQSIELRSGLLGPGIVPAYASSLTAVIERLNAARAQWGAQLGTAASASLQAEAAQRLAAAHAQAAAALTGLTPGPAAGVNAAFVAALRADAAAYSALARAAADQRADAYRSAAAAIAQLSATLQSDLAALRSFGYRTS